MNNAYQALRDRQQAEFNSFPMKAAFSNIQFREAMAEWGFSEKDTDKVVGIGGGCFVRKSDYEAFLAMARRHVAELNAEIEKDVSGEGFIRDMFTYELNNHEAAYTGDIEETLDVFGYSWEQIRHNPRLAKGLALAIEDVMKEIQSLTEEEETEAPV